MLYGALLSPSTSIDRCDLISEDDCPLVTVLAPSPSAIAPKPVRRRNSRRDRLVPWRSSDFILFSFLFLFVRSRLVQKGLPMMLAKEVEIKRKGRSRWCVQSLEKSKVAKIIGCIMRNV